MAHSQQGPHAVGKGTSYMPERLRESRSRFRPPSLVLVFLLLVSVNVHFANAASFLNMFAAQQNPPDPLPGRAEQTPDDASQTLSTPLSARRSRLRPPAGHHPQGTVSQLRTRRGKWCVTVSSVTQITPSVNTRQSI